MYNLSERLLNFGIDVIKLLRKVPNKEEYKIIRHQLIKSSTSAGANYEELQELKNILGSICSKTNRKDE